MLGRVADHTEVDKASVPMAVLGFARLVAGIAMSPARSIKVDYPSPVIAFSDGAVEYDHLGAPVITVGGVVLRRGSRPRAFGCRVGTALVNQWLSRTRHPVMLAELLPKVLLRMLFPDAFRDAAVLNFEDNEAARFATIAGYSAHIDAAVLVSELASQDAQLRSACWWARVPTGGNPADCASRLRFDLLLEIFPDALVVPCFDDDADHPGWAALASRLYKGVDTLVIP